MVALANLEGWSKEEELGAKEGCSELPASPQQTTYKCITVLAGLSYSNHGNWEAASFSRFPSINITVTEHMSKYSPLSEKKSALFLLLLFSSRTTFLSSY